MPSENKPAIFRLVSCTVEFALEQAMKDQRWRKGIDLLFL
jgi:hypothetical protein